MNVIINHEIGAFPYAPITFICDIQSIYIITFNIMYVCLSGCPSQKWFWMISSKSPHIIYSQIKGQCHSGHFCSVFAPKFGFPGDISKVPSHNFTKFTGMMHYGTRKTSIDIDLHRYEVKVMRLVSLLKLHGLQMVYTSFNQSEFEILVIKKCPNTCVNEFTKHSK